MTGGGVPAAAVVDLGASRKWTLCVMLFLATTLNYLDRQTVSILAPTIQREMRFDNEALGLLFSVFYYTYTFSQLAVGLVLDRANLRWTYGLAVLAWSATAGLTGLSGNLAALMVFRGLLGVAESANWPAAMRIVVRALPPRDRTLGNGIFTSGTSVAALIAPAAILGIAGWLSWRAAFGIVGSFGAAWLIGWLLFTRSSSLAPIWRDSQAELVQPKRSLWRAYRDVASGKQFWRVFLLTIVVNPCLYFNVNWLPTYFAQQWRLEQGATLGWVLTAIYLGLDLGYVACGAGVMALVHRGVAVRTARRMVFTVATVLMATAALVPFASRVESAMALLVTVNFGTAVWISIYLTLAQEVSERDVSTAAGLLGGSGSFAGAIAMWAVGKSTQLTSSFTPAFVALAVAGLLAWIAGWQASRDHRAGVRPARGPA